VSTVVLQSVVIFHFFKILGRTSFLAAPFFISIMPATELIEAFPAGSSQFVALGADTIVVAA
jgi:hypothetical protein